MVMSHRIRMRTESFFYICMQQSNKKSSKKLSRDNCSNRSKSIHCFCLTRLYFRSKWLKARDIFYSYVTQTQ